MLNLSSVGRHRETFHLNRSKEGPYGWALQYAAEDLRADRKIVLKALRQDANAFEYASTGLRADRKFVSEAVKKNGTILNYA